MCSGIKEGPSVIIKYELSDAITFFRFQVVRSQMLTSAPKGSVTGRNQCFACYKTCYKSTASIIGCCIQFLTCGPQRRPPGFRFETSGKPRGVQPGKRSDTRTGGLVLVRHANVGSLVGSLDQKLSSGGALREGAPQPSFFRARKKAASPRKRKARKECFGKNKSGGERELKRC